MSELRPRFSLRELLMVVSLFGILASFAIQVHRQLIQAPSERRLIPWHILIAFAVWLAAWLGVGLRTRRRPSDFGQSPISGELLLAGAASAMMANGVGLTLLARGWSVGAGPDPIRTLFWLTVLFLMFDLAAAATIFYRPMRRQFFYLFLSLAILGAVALHNFYALAQTMAAV